MVNGFDAGKYIKTLYQLSAVEVGIFRADEPEAELWAALEKL